MYETYFGLKRRPFAPGPAPDQYFPGETIEAARKTVTRCIQRAEGAAMVVGPSGTGKTLLCHVLAGQFRSALAVGLLASGRLSSRSALYQSILYHLGRSYRGMEEGELRLALVDFLTTSENRPDGLVLLVDEAHTLPLRILEEIRMLTNLVCSGESRVRVVLVGGPVLEERFASPRLESFTQRLRARCYLASLGREETEKYICSQIAGAGGDARGLFAVDAFAAVFRATDGVPRLVNQVCDHVLLLACSEGISRIDAARIEEAWADLQQLPTPYSAKELAHGEGSATIEFGGLDDDDDESATTATTPIDIPGEFDSLDEPMDRIERTLAELDEVERACEATEDEFRPAGSIGPEVELVFEEVGNPFRESFENEEFIVQRYKSARPPRAAIAKAAARQAADDKPEAAADDPELGQAAGPTPSESDRRRTLPIHRPDHAAAPRAETLLLGDDDAVDPSMTPRIVVARRLEYRQLFSKLRRG
ncbi:MAG: AAA family ATPase [Pirellulales bacterium]|nr:AAA family ATPase [Pirellulales bacterium]